MPLMYLIIAPVFGIALYKRLWLIYLAIQYKNSSAIKANMFFLVLTVLVGGGLIFQIQRSA